MSGASNEAEEQAMRRNGSAQPRLALGLRGALAAGGALAVGLWLGVAVGLATRRRQDQPSGPPVYDRPGEVGGPPDEAPG